MSLAEASAPYEDMSVSLLAAQPLSAPDTTKELQDWQEIYNHLESTLGTMRSWRWAKWAYWQILARFFLPFRYLWVVTANMMSRGGPVNDSIVNATGLLAVRTCASGMWTGLTSPSRPWFKLDIALPWVKLQPEGQSWLEDTLSRMYTVLQQSNWYSAMSQAFRDLVVFGTAVVLIYEDAEDVIRLYVACAGEYFLGAGPRLDIVKLYREFTFDTSQIVGMFKLENCPKEVQGAWREGATGRMKEWVVAHGIEPNAPIPGKGGGAGVQVVSSEFPWFEVYWLRGFKSEKPLSKRGFNLKPFMVFRWATVTNDPYGHGVCEEALGDNKQVQLEDVRKAEFIDKGVRPAMGAHPSLKNEPASIRPAGITYIDTSGGNKGFWPLFEPKPEWLQGITADIAKVEARVERTLFVDLFMAITRMEGVQPRNQLELSKRDLERLQELGPVIELAEKELDVGIARILNIMTRRKLIQPVPDSLHGVPLKTTYTSILRLAQRAAESIAMKDVFQVGGVLSSAAKSAGVPDPLRTINLDKAFRHYADLAEFPGSLFYTDGQVAQHDQIRQEEAQKAQIPGQAQAAVEAAKTMADTSTAPGSALSAMLGGSKVDRNELNGIIDEYGKISAADWEKLDALLRDMPPGWPGKVQTQSSALLSHLIDESINVQAQMRRASFRVIDGGKT